MAWSDLMASPSAEVATRRLSAEAATLMEEVEMEVANQGEEELFQSTLELLAVDRLEKTDA